MLGDLVRKEKVVHENQRSNVESIMAMVMGLLQEFSIAIEVGSGYEGRGSLSVNDRVSPPMNGFKVNYDTSYKDGKGVLG